MNKIFGYGEDAFTIWALKKHISEILTELDDQSALPGCLISFRPSFGRRGGEGSAEFGEFDTILASSENVYLIKSKWDNLSPNKNDEIKLKNEQILRHRIFSWYFMKWEAQHYRNWKEFCNASQKDFRSNFPAKKIAPEESILARNLEFILKKLHEHCKRDKELKNVLLYFYNSNKSKQIKKVITDGLDVNFEVINMEYGQHISGNFISLD
jgi:hypothetical protein